MLSFQVVKLTADTPFERGVQYGEQAKEKIIAGVDSYREIFRQTMDSSWESIKKYTRHFIEYLEKELPDILMEAKGIAKGAEVDLEDIMVLNCRYEITKFPFIPECTTCAVLPEAAEGNKTYLVKNWDYRAGIIDNIVILHIENSNGTEIIGLAEAGQLIREGFNSNGVGIVNNALKSKNDNTKIGIPVTFLRRRVLDSKTYAEAKEYIENAKREVSNNILIASKDGEALDMEVHPLGVEKIEPVKGIITHANHFVAKREINDGEESPRDERLKALLMKHHGCINVDIIKQALADHENYPKAICRHPADASLPLFRRSMTVAAMIVDFEESTVHICAGPPCEGEFKAFKLNKKM